MDIINDRRMPRIRQNSKALLSHSP